MMIPVTFVQPDGTRREVLATDGRSLMQAAIDGGVAGILALCGGSAACGTCHVYVEERFLAALPAPLALEDQMLESTASPRQPNSRLSCQVVVRPTLRGAQITCPPNQD